MASSKSVAALLLLGVASAHYSKEQDGCYMRFGEDKEKCDASGPFCTWLSGPGWGKCILSEEGREHVAKQHEHGDHEHHDDDDDDDDEHEHHGRHGPAGSPVLCPFLQAVIPKAQEWMMRVDRLIETMNSKDFEELPFSEDHRLVVHKALSHAQGGKATAHATETYSGPGNTVRALRGLFDHIEEVRVRGAYPDFARTTAMVAIQAFSRCPHSGQMFSSEWLLDVLAIGRGGIQEMELYMNAWQAVGGEEKPAANGSGILARTVVALGRAVGRRNASELVPLLSRDVHVELADAYFRQEKGDDDDIYDRDEEADAMDGADKMLSFLQDQFAEQKKFMPLEFLEFGRGYYAGELGNETAAVITGSTTMKVIFSPKVKDWHGAVKVQAAKSAAGAPTDKIGAIKLYPIEMAGLVERWGWKYGDHGCVVHKLATAAFRATHRHPAIAIAAVLGFLGACGFSVCCLAVRCCRVKRRVAIRDLEAPLQDLSSQGGASRAPYSAEEASA